MSKNQLSRIGLVAGAGEIPIYFADKASKNGIRLVSIGFTDEIQSHLAPFSEKTYSIGVGKTSKIFKTLKDEGIKEVLILGKVDKSIIFRMQMFDLRTIKFFNSLKNREDKTLMLGVIEEMRKEGFVVMDQREFMQEIFPGPGLLSKREPTKDEMEDIQFGLPIAKKMADMEIGQTVVVHNKIVIAVEAIEGTDRVIERGCALAKGKAVVVKVSRTDQDYRFDSPGIGPKTIEGLVAGGAGVLALEADRVMVANQSKVEKMADRAGLSVICV